MNTKYDDMIHMPHHISPARAQISMADRAAQFSPFAALTGYEAAIKETARLTDKRIELTEDALNELNRNYQLLTDRLRDHSEVRITYFKPDDRKEGGAYVTVCGKIRKIDTFRKQIQLTNGTIVPTEDVVDIVSALP